MDEVAQLLLMQTEEGVDFFLCLCRASKTSVQSHTNSFFVFLSTDRSQSVNYIITPGRYCGPSSTFFFFSGEKEVFEALAPFLLHHAMGVISNETENPQNRKYVTVCPSPENLIAKGKTTMALLTVNTLLASPTSFHHEGLLDFALSNSEFQNTMWPE